MESTTSIAACSSNWLLELICLFKPSLPAPVLAGLMVLVPVVCWLIVAEWKILGDPANPAFQKQINRIRSRADRAAVAERYRGWLDSLLQGIDHLFGPVTKARPGSLADRWFGCQPWTAVSYERLLNLAFVYPFVFLILGVFLENESEDGRLIVLYFFPMGVAVGYTAGIVVRRKLERRIVSIGLRSLLLVVVVFVVVGVGVGGGSGSGVAFASAFAFVFAFAFAGVAATAGIAATATATATATAGAATAGVAGVAGVAAGAAGALTFLRYKTEHRIATFYLVVTPSILGFFVLLSIYYSVSGLIGFLLFTVFLPLFNAPLDWLSLGVTRGLLLHIKNGRHSSLSALGWALIDIALAFLFILAVAASSFMAYWLARWISPESVYSIEKLRETVAGGDEMSVGIWLMLASTLLPTFLHFLVALLAFVSLPFSREKATETADQLQAACDKAKQRDDTNANQAAGEVRVDAYARRWAMGYFFMNWQAAFLLWIGLVLYLGYLIYEVMQWLFLELLKPAI